MTERTFSGYMPALKDNRKPNTRTSDVSARRRNYPGADYATSQLVTKLRARGSSDGGNLNRTASSELMKDAYKTVPVRNANIRRASSANVSEVSSVINNNYSPYSNVNVTAVKEAKRHEAERNGNRSVASATIRSTSARTANAPRPASAESRVVRAESKPMPVKKDAPRPTEVKFRSVDTNGQLAESGPREMVFKRVPFPKLAIMILLLSLIFFLMVQSIMHNFQYQREIADLQVELDELNDRAEELRLELESRDDYAEIELRAEAIGMIKNSDVEEKYISLQNSDVIENFGDKEEGYGSFTTMLSAVSRQLSRFLGGE